MKNSLIVISYFDARPKTQLNSLVSQLKKFNTPILISINGHKTKRATFFKDNKN